MIRIFSFKLFPTFLVVAMFILQGCSKGPGDINPAKSDQWKQVAGLKGHHDQTSERFQTNGQPLMITYEAKATKEWTHCNFEVFLVKGIEEMYDAPVISSLNNDEIAGKKRVHPDGQSYYLRLKVLEMHYEVKVYRKKAPDPTKAT